jgi:hypothetical protein
MSTETNLQSKIFEIQPAERVWQKLEQQLEAHEKQNRVLPLRHKWRWAAAAACLLALAAAWFNSYTDEKPGFSSGLYAPPKNLEELPLSAEGSHCGVCCLSLRMRHTLPEYYQQPRQKNT